MQVNKAFGFLDFEPRNVHSLLLLVIENENNAIAFQTVRVISQ